MQPVFPGVQSVRLWGGWDGLRLIVRLFGGARTGCAREGECWTDCRGLQSSLGLPAPQVEIIHLRPNYYWIMRHHSCPPPNRALLLDIKGCSPKLTHTADSVAIGYGAHLSSVHRATAPCFILLFSTLHTVNLNQRNYSNATVLLTLDLSLVFTLSEVLSALSLPINRAPNTLFRPPLKVLSRPRIISNTYQN